MKNNFLKYILVVLAVFGLALFCQVVLPSMGLFFLGPWLVFAFIFILNFFFQTAFFVFAAFLAGALLDFVSFDFFGTFALTFLFVAVFIRFVKKYFQKSNIFSFVFALIISGLIFFCLGHLLKYL